MIKIHLSKEQVDLALEDYIRSKGYITGQGVIIEEKETMSDHWYEAWAWVEKEGDVEELENSK